MPQIREYNNPIEGLRTSDTGASAIAKIGSTAANLAYYTGQALTRAIGNFGGAAAEAYEQHIVQPEITKGAALLTGIQNDLTGEWQQTASNPDNLNDSTVGDTFRERALAPRLQEFLGGFQTAEGRRWASAQVEQTTRHFNERVTADMSTRAGHAAVANVMKIGNNLAGMVSRDPSSFDMAIQQADELLTQVLRSPNLAPGTAAQIHGELTQRMRNGIAEAYITALARRDPDEALEALKSERLTNFLTANDIRQMEGVIRGQRRIDQAEERAERDERRRARVEQTNSSIMKIWNETITADPNTGELHIAPGAFNRLFNETSRIPGVDPHSVNAALGAMRAIQNHRRAPIETDPETFDDFSRRVTQPEDQGGLTIQEVFRAMSERRLSPTDFTLFKDWVTRDERNPANARDMRDLTHFFDSVKPFITRSTILQPNGDPTGAWMFGQFQRDAIERFRAARKAGRPVGEILNDLQRRVPFFVTSGDQAIRNLNDRANVSGGVIALPDFPQELRRQDESDNARSRVRGAFEAVVPEGQRYQPGESIEAYARRLRERRKQ